MSALSSCGGASSSPIFESDKEQLGAQAAFKSGELSHPIATMSCTVNGGAIGLAFCFSAPDDKLDGTLKIASGSNVHQFTELELHNHFPEPEYEFPLDNPFTIQAQTNSDPLFVLRIEIRDRSKVIFTDEASRLCTIYASSDLLS